jgi:sugar/nucleoside kinase (ribokinase family)
MTPDFLVIGHVVQDLLDGGWRAGGAVTYAGGLARNLGLSTAVVTSCADDFPLGQVLEGMEVHRVPASETTQIRNVYTADGRKQWLPRRAANIRAGDVPPEWRRSGIVLLGAVAGELEDGIASEMSAGLLGIGVQGWLREVGPGNAVHPVSLDTWSSGPLVDAVDAVFLSVEDLPATELGAAVESWAARTRIVAVTRGEDGADIYYQGERRHIRAFPARAVDPTGAGDVFAAAYLIRYDETSDPWESARFAAAAGACITETEGATGIPDRFAIEARLDSGPGIVAKPY